MLVLGIETSCDETAAAVIKRNKYGHGYILSNVISSQINDHIDYGGIVPEIAARSHIKILDKIIEKSLKDANISLLNIDVIAATSGPGLIGCLIVGLITGRTIALAANKSFFPINHLEGHALTANLTHKLLFPYLFLLISGGHTQIIIVHSFGNYQRISTTLDDALGEAFDKIARLVGLSYPGGFSVEKSAISGDSQRFIFPRPLQNTKQVNFSFSGLKTAVRKIVLKLSPLKEQDISDICSSFQESVIDILSSRLTYAFCYFKKIFPDIKYPVLVASGGVATNNKICQSLDKICKNFGFKFIVPPKNLCTDNAAMIAWVGSEYKARNKILQNNIVARPRWPLDENSVPIVGSGKKGPKV